MHINSRLTECELFSLSKEVQRKREEFENLEKDITIFTFFAFFKQNYLNQDIRLMSSCDTSNNFSIYLCIDNNLISIEEIIDTSSLGLNNLAYVCYEMNNINFFNNENGRLCFLEKAMGQAKTRQWLADDKIINFKNDLDNNLPEKPVTQNKVKI